MEDMGICDNLIMVFIPTWAEETGVMEIEKGMHLDGVLPEMDV